MQVHVEYVAQLRTAAGQSAETISGPVGATVAMIARLACDRHPDLRAILCTQSGELHPSILVFRGEEPCAADSPVVDGETLTFLSPVSGG